MKLFEKFILEFPLFDSVSSEHNRQIKFFVAYSGGLDSHVLLHLLSRLCNNHPSIDLIAVHVNHNVNPKSKLWDSHCRQVCEELNLEYISESINPKFKDESLEEGLRKLRYGVFARLLHENGYVMTAHHANDQAETLLLQLFRGAGPKGLASMPYKTKFSNGWLVRPLLKFSRDELLEYAFENSLNWIEDDSNLNTKFDRNFIRHDLIPVIKQKWPAIIKVLNRGANHCAETTKLLDILAAQDFKKTVSCENPSILFVDQLKNLEFIRQKNLLRYWLSNLKLTMPSDAKLSGIINDAINSRYDAMPIIKWKGAEVRRFRNCLYAMPPIKNFNTRVELRFNGSKLELPADLGDLVIRVSSNSIYSDKKFIVRFRQGGERLRLPGRKGRSYLKKLMQEWDIPPWLRNRTPLVYCKNEIVAVVGCYSVSGITVMNNPKNGGCE